MMNILLRRLTLLSVLLFTLTGCGDLFKKKVTNKSLDPSFARASCDLDVNRFSLILHELIPNDIKCLQANLHRFINLVQTDIPGTMSRTDFEAYLRNYRSDDMTPEIINAVRAVWDLNHLLTGDNREYISKASVDKIVNFALIFNEEAYKYFSKTFQDESPVAYNIHEYQRQQVKESAVRIRSELGKLFNRNPNETRKLDIIKDLLERFTTPETSGNINKIKEVLFVKKVLLGGDKQEITNHEINMLINSFPDLTTLALDGVRSRYIQLKQDSLVSLLASNVTNLYTIIFTQHAYDRSKEEFFNMDEVFRVVEMFIGKDKFDINKYKKLVLEGKKIIMGGSSDKVTGADFKNLMEHGYKVLKTGKEFHRMYKYFLVPLESKLGPIVINFEQHKDVFYDAQDEFKKFIRIVKNYRFMKGEFESPYYSREWWRNADGVFEIYLFEYLIEQVLSYTGPTPYSNDEAKACKDLAGKPETGSSVPWGLKGSATGDFNFRTDQCHLTLVVQYFQRELVNSGLIMPGRAVSISDTISLLATLFQNQSSMVHEDVPMLDVNEGTEFALTLISGTSMATEIMKEFKETCGGSFDEYDRVEPVCFKKYFLRNFCNVYKSSYPLLFNSIGGAQSCDDIEMDDFNSHYLQYSIEAARTCNYYNDAAGKPTAEEIYYSEGDVMTIVVGMMHIEATMIRWDQNRNDMWDPNEAEMAYSVYSPALDGFLMDKPSIIKKLKKQIYYYLLKYEKVPPQEGLGNTIQSGWSLLKLLTGITKPPGATRKTMAAVLRAIGNENIATRMKLGEKVWDCNLMRHPDQIDPDYDPNNTKP
jgi:hypothetical protein